MLELASGWSESSYNWEHDCEMRLVHVTARDTARGMFLNGTLEAIGGLAGSGVMKRCLEAAGQERFESAFHYSIGLQLRMLSVAMPTLIARTGSCELALRQLGRSAALDFLGSAAGKMMVGLSRSEPRRLLNSLSSLYRASVSYGTQVVEWTGPTRGRIHLKRDFMPPPFHEGMVGALLELGGAQGARLTGRMTSRLDSEYSFSWM